MIAILGIFYTINNSEKRFSQDTINQSLPYFVFEFYNINFKKTRFMNFSNHENEADSILESEDMYSEEKLNDYYFVIENKRVSIRKSLKNNDRDLVENGGLVNIKIDNGVVTCQKDYAYLSGAYINVGKCCAVNTYIGLNESSCEAEKRKYINPNQYFINDSIGIHIFSKDPNSFGNYDLEIVYEDIYGNKYEQKKCLHFEAKDERFSFGLEIRDRQEKHKSS